MTERQRWINHCTMMQVYYSAYVIQKRIASLSTFSLYSTMLKGFEFASYYLWKIGSFVSLCVRDGLSLKSHKKSMRKLPHRTKMTKLETSEGDAVRDGWGNYLLSDAIDYFFRSRLGLSTGLTERNVKWQSLATKDKRPNFSHNNQTKLIRVGKHK